MNLNPEAKRLLVFGDSNTWGYIPNSNHLRYTPQKDIREFYKTV